MLRLVIPASSPAQGHKLSIRKAVSSRQTGPALPKPENPFLPCDPMAQLA